jgi:HK97 gp10 family phage protein
MADVTIKGVRRLARKLRDMPGPVREATRSALEQAAIQIVATMRQLAPVRTGSLRNSIGWTWGKVPKSVLAVATARDPSGNVLTIFAGNQTAFYARWIEFGTRPHSLAKRASTRRRKRQDQGTFHPGSPAQAFFFPSYRAHKKSAKRQVSAAIRKSIKNVAAGGGAYV